MLFYVFGGQNVTSTDQCGAPSFTGTYDIFGLRQINAKDKVKQMPLIYVNLRKATLISDKLYLSLILNL